MRIDQIVNYWKDKIGVGSVWLTQEYNTSYITVLDIFYVSEYNSVMVSYRRNGAPGTVVETIDTRKFMEYVAHSRVS